MSGFASRSLDRGAPEVRATVGPDASRPQRCGPVTALGLAGSGGWVLSFAFPATDWWWLAPAAVAALLLAARGRSVRAASVLGLVFGFMFLTPHLSWSGVYVGALPWAALVVSQSLFFCAMGAALPAAWNAPGRLGQGVALSGLWVLMEATRSRVPFGGFPWGRLAFSQAGTPVGRWAWLGGAPLVTAVLVCCGTLLAMAVLEGLAGRRWRGTALVAGSGGLVLLGSLWPVSPATAAGDSTLPVAAVQGNVPRPGLDFNAERRAVLDNHVRATVDHATAVRDGRAEQPAVVLWPENSSDIDPLRNDDAAQVITQAADAVNAPILVGAILREPLGYRSNVGIVWGPTGSAAAGPGQRYAKRRPAPFAEYIPHRRFFRLFSDKVDLVRHDVSPGRVTGVLRMGPVTVGDVICFEVVYDSLVRDTVRAGADLLVVQTNNATFGRTPESVQQLAVSRLRAIETGRAVVHISTVGVSALIAPDGSVVRRSGHFRPEVLSGRIPVREGITPAVRVGPLAEYLLAILGIALTLWGARGRGVRLREGRPSATELTTTPAETTTPGEGDEAAARDGRRGEEPAPASTS